MIVNATIVWDVNCSFSCGGECWKSSRYPCLQVYVSLNSSGKVVRLSHNEETQDRNPEVSIWTYMVQGGWAQERPRITNTEGNPSLCNAVAENVYFLNTFGRGHR